jgi:diamine N-acetyltransferase
MITLRKITLDNRRQVFNLEVSEEQRKFVASNLSSIATAYVLATNGGHPMPFAIYNDEIVVGFVLIAYGITSYELPAVAENNYTIIRLMIGKQYQNQGFGREALNKILEYIRTFPVGNAKYCWLEYAHENTVAEKLYKKMGFVDNGEVVNNEKVAIIEL